jgi:NAD(P)-dependent dehydrogenase (short-subunit alcohol dehydrogenase family)
MHDQFDLTGRIALVTGAGSGLGRSFAMVLAQAGARVAVAGRRADKLDATVAEIRSRGGTAEACVMDVTEPAAVGSSFDAIEQRLGAVEILVNNAGISRVGLLADASEEDWSAVIDTNLTAVHRVAREAARRLQAAGRPGTVINIASILGLRVHAGLGAYAAAKAAVVHLTKVQALEWARSGIRANAIAPGYFETEMNAGYFDTDAGRAMTKRIPLRRIGNIDELAGALLLLASDASSYMTGSVLTVDGGHTCSSL